MRDRPHLVLPMKAAPTCGIQGEPSDASKAEEKGVSEMAREWGPMQKIKEGVVVLHLSKRRVGWPIQAPFGMHRMPLVLGWVAGKDGHGLACTL